MLRDAAQPFSIITRGPLIVRDADLLAEAARRADVSVTFSVPTLDDEVWRTTEPGTAPPRQRLRALRVLVEHGVRASVGMAPLLPGLSDRPEPARARSSRPRARPAPAASGRTSSTSSRARASTSSTCLARDWPELLPDYERLYARRAYLAAADAAPARERGAEARPRARDPRPPAASR